MSSYLKPELGKAYTVALKFLESKPVKGFNGPELRWVLMDGQLLYTPVDFGRRIFELRIKPGHRFTFIRQRENGRVVWKIERLPQPAADLLNGQALDYPEEVIGGDCPPPVLEEALRIAVKSAVAAHEHGKRIGYDIRFSSRDIQQMALAILEKNGKVA